ncbi:hypothetical protein HDU67_004879 [Dinochytrium kinnereticum]|nr:hypothetical protein HDU67_004879 [Dinochytrium kinnereticum]
MSLLSGIANSLLLLSRREEEEAVEEDHHDLEEVEELDWYSRVSIKVLTGVNGLSLALSLLALFAFILGRIKSPRLFDRTSLKIILFITIADAIFHSSYIYSMYLGDELNCKISCSALIFGSLFEAFLITCLAVNLVIITFSRMGGENQTFTFPLMLGCSFLASFAFATSIGIPTPVEFVIIDVRFIDPTKLSVTFLSIAFVNVILAAAIYLKLKQHVRSLNLNFSNVPTIFDRIPTILADRPPVLSSPMTSAEDEEGGIVVEHFSKSDNANSEPGLGFDTRSLNDTTSAVVDRLEHAKSVTKPLLRGHESSGNPPWANSVMIRGGLRSTSVKASATVSFSADDPASCISQTNRCEVPEKLNIQPRKVLRSSSFAIRVIREHGERKKEEKSVDSDIQGDSVILVLPFITEIATCLVDTTNTDNTFAQMMQSVMESSKGFFTFLVLLQDPAIQRALSNAFDCILGITVVLDVAGEAEGGCFLEGVVLEEDGRWRCRFGSVK